MKLLRRLLIQLGLMCVCGGWRTVFKRPRIQLAEVTLSNGAVEPVYLKMRPCKKCGRAPANTQVVKLKSGHRIGGFPQQTIVYKDIKHEH